MSQKEDVEFLTTYLKKLLRRYGDLQELCYPNDFYTTPSNDKPIIDPEDKRAARLADNNDFDGSLFLDLTTNDPNPTSLQSMRRLKKKIETIPRIIAKIEKSTKEAQSVELPLHFVACSEISGIIRKPLDAIARTLRAAGYPVIKKAGKNYCDPNQAAVLFPKWKKHLKNWQENE